MKAKQILSDQVRDPQQLAAIYQAFDAAWAKIAAAVGTDPQAIEVARMRLASLMLTVDPTTGPDLMADEALKGYHHETKPTPIKR